MNDLFAAGFAAGAGAGTGAGAAFGAGAANGASAFWKSAFSMKAADITFSSRHRAFSFPTDMVSTSFCVKDGFGGSGAFFGDALRLLLPPLLLELRPRRRFRLLLLSELLSSRLRRRPFRLSSRPRLSSRLRPPRLLPLRLLARLFFRASFSSPRPRFGASRLCFGASFNNSY